MICAMAGPEALLSPQRRAKPLNFIHNHGTRRRLDNRCRATKFCLPRDLGDGRDAKMKKNQFSSETAVTKSIAVRS
jgi:hypothetical protein